MVGEDAILYVPVQDQRHIRTACCDYRTDMFVTLPNSYREVDWFAETSNDTVVSGYFCE